MEEVMEALKDDTVYMIQICGDGGVGKTTMVNKIVSRVKEEKLIYEVAMVVVSRTTDLKNIRDAIADQLGLELDEQNEEGRAAQLHAKILLVLDDVWDVLPFEWIGHLLGSGYKILITSRRRDVVVRRGRIIRNSSTFLVPTLTEDEAWSLFKESAGSCCEDPDILPVAKQILKECGGLPIAIVTVGSTLRSAGSYETEWRDALQKLKRLRNIEGEDLILLSCIKLSYDYLKCKEHQRFFLLCCLFPEDADIPIETLLRYVMGLGLLANHSNSFQEARNRVCTLVNELSRLCLLLKSKKPEHVMMHDDVRAVGIYLASEDMENHGLMNTCKYFNNFDEVLLEKNAGELDPARLKLLWLSELEQNIPCDFLEGMKKLNVLSLSKSYRVDYHLGKRPKLPALQFHGLRNIRTLCLEYYNLENVDLSKIGTLESLQVLSFYGSHGVWLPSQLGFLSRLRLLDCRCYKPGWGADLKISYGVLSGLKQLEELYLVKMDWEEEKEEKEIASVGELWYLRELTTLIITLPGAHLVDPNYYLHVEKLVRFDINIGCKKVEMDENLPFRNTLAISLKFGRIQLHMGILINALVMKIEILHVHGEKLHERPNYWFYDAENLFEAAGIYSNTIIISQLQELYLYNLPKLRHVWKNGALACQVFQNLKTLIVRNCESMEHIVGEKDEEDEERAVGVANILFPKLVTLHLKELRNLISFCGGNKYTLDWMSGVQIILDDCPQLQIFSSRVIIT